MTDRERIDRIELAVVEIRATLGVLMAQKVERGIDPKAADREINRSRVLAVIASTPAGKTMAELRRAFVRLPEQDVRQAVAALVSSGAVKMVDTNAGREKANGVRIRARMACVAVEEA